VLAACVGGALGVRGAGIDRDVGLPEVQVASERPAPIEAAPDARQALAGGRTPRPPLPQRADVRRAGVFARARAGLVALAVIDTRGRMHGVRPRARFPAASVVKAALLAARLRALERGGQPLAEAERQRFEAMIRWSDNDAADAVYAAVGDAALVETVRRGGMRRFTIAGHWGNAQITAADGARFMSNLRRVLGERYRPLAMELLASVVPGQRWGIPEVAPGWRIWFKGGWTDTRRGELVSQAALLERRGRRIAMAILTDAQPSQEYGRDSLRGVAARLLGRQRGGRRE